jgi:cell division protein FtsB
MTTAPRSGGRTTEQVGKSRRKTAGTTTGSTTAGTTTAGTTTGGGARGARHYPTVGATQGSAALKLSVEQQRDPITTPRLRVAPPAPINAPRAPFIVLVVAVVVAGVLGILLINTKTAENSFRIDTLQKQQAKLDSQQQALENEIAANNSPGSLDAAARRLGLVKADNPAYIRLPDGKIFGVPKPGSGEVAVTAQDSASSATGR